MLTLENWTLIRIIRLVMGLIMLMQFFENQDKFAGVLSIILLYQGIANVGCCTNSCQSNISPKNNKNEEITFEEIKE